MRHQWLTLAEARGKIIADRRCDADEAATILESDLAEGCRRARGHRVTQEKYRTEAEKGPDGRIARWVEIEIEPAGTPAPGQPKEEIPKAWWAKAAGASYVSDVIPRYDKNEVRSAWKYKYVNVEISQEQVSTRTQNKGGRPQTRDWDLFAARIIQIANKPDGLPDRAELQRRMMDWCAEQWGDDAPAESTVRDRLSRLLRLR